MPARKKTTKAPGQGMTAKQMKRRKPISEDYMLPIEPLTDNQKVMFDAWDEGKMVYMKKKHTHNNHKIIVRNDLCNKKC